MLQYEKVDVSEGIDVNKTNASKEYELRHYWFLKDVRFKFEEHVCNRCHDLLTMAHMAILNAKETIFRCLLRSTKKKEVLNNSVTYDRRVL